MKIKLKFGVIVQSLVTIIVMQGAQAEDLFTVYLHAKERDYKVRIAEEDYIARLEQSNQALADLKPKVTLSARAGYNAGRNWNDLGNSNTSTASGNYTLSLTKPLYRPQVSERIVQSSLVIAQAEEALIAEQQNLILRVAEAYFGYLQARDAAELAREEANSLAHQSAQVTAFFEAGRSAFTAVQESRARLAEARSNIFSMDQNIEIALEKLYSLTGQEYKVLSGTPDQTPLRMPEPNNINAWLEEASVINSQVIAALFAVEIAQKSVDIAIAAKRPTIDFFANQGSSASFGRAGSDSQSLEASFGIQLNSSRYDSGKTDAMIREAQDNVRKALLQVEVQRDTAVQQTQSNFLTIETGEAQIGAFWRSLQASQAAAKATQGGFEAGTRTAVDVILSVRDVYRAERNFVSAKYNFLLNTIRLKQSAGILGEEDLRVLSNIMNRTRTTWLVD